MVVISGVCSRTARPSRFPARNEASRDNPISYARDVPHGAVESGRTGWERHAAKSLMSLIISLIVLLATAQSLILQSAAGREHETRYALHKIMPS